MDIGQQRIRNKDQDGVLLHAGFSWTQPILLREKIYVAALWTSSCAAMVTGPFFYKYLTWTGPYQGNFLNSVVLTTFVVSACVFVAATVLTFTCPMWASHQAAVAFSADDSIWVTERRRIFQSYARMEWWCLSRKASDVTSIEITTVRNNGGGHYRHGGKDGYLAHDVFIQFGSGERLYVAECLDEQDAHIVAAQLKIAHREMQSVMAYAA